MFVRSLVTAPPVAVTGSSTLRAASTRMVIEGVDSLVVTEPTSPGDVSGVFTRGDLVAALAVGADPDETLVWEFMSATTGSVESRARIEDAATAMYRHGSGHVLVTEVGDIIGLVSKEDLLAAALDETAVWEKLDAFGELIGSAAVNGAGSPDRELAHIRG